jgi:hypothetical protein
MWLASWVVAQWGLFDEINFVLLDDLRFFSRTKFISSLRFVPKEV